eukprot:scaffold13797_cov102-Isochrysis_galbana.AAC.1
MTGRGGHGSTDGAVVREEDSDRGWRHGPTSEVLACGDRRATGAWPGAAPGACEAGQWRSSVASSNARQWGPKDGWREAGAPDRGGI